MLILLLFCFMGVTWNSHMKLKTVTECTVFCASTIEVRTNCSMKNMFKSGVNILKHVCDVGQYKGLSGKRLI